MLRPHKLFPNEPAWLPNSAGFKFEALRRDGTVQLGEVVRGPDGMHTTAGISYRDILRWRSAQ